MIKLTEQTLQQAKAENDRKEALQIEATLGGTATAGQIPEKPKEMTDTEYSQALQKGEVNPLKEDGFI